MHHAAYCGDSGLTRFLVTLTQPQTTKFLATTTTPLSALCLAHPRSSSFDPAVCAPTCTCCACVPPPPSSDKRSQHLILSVLLCLGTAFHRYDFKQKLLRQETLVKGDVLILVGGGHGFEILEEGTVMMEVKQGPYAGAKDKVHF